MDAIGLVSGTYSSSCHVPIVVHTRDTCHYTSAISGHTPTPHQLRHRAGVKVVMAVFSGRQLTALSSPYNMVSRASSAERVQNLMCIKRLLIGRTSCLVAGGWCPPPSSPWMMSNEPHHLGHQLGSDSISQAGHRAHTTTPRPHTPRPPLCWCWVNV